MRVLIIGAGIGGLTAAAALRQQGIEAHVYERSPDLGEVGAGLQLGPNAMKVIRALGIEAEVLEQAFQPTNMVSIRWDDASLRFRDPLKDVSVQRYGAPYACTHRADLHRSLARLSPESSIHPGMRCTAVTARGVQFADGSELEADVIVGADGIRSIVREQLFGADAPRFTHQMAWRCIVPIEAVPTRIGPGGSVHLDRAEYHGWLGPNGHVICYPIRAGRLLNIFAGHVSDEWVEESWTLRSSVDEMLEAYAGWNEALLGMLRAVQGGCYKWGIYDRDPLASWVRGRAALLGDAAHPMMPTLAQGAAITMEDGYVLAQMLARHADDPVQGLRAYDAARRPRASRVQLQARQQFENNRKVPPPPPLDRDWIFNFRPQDSRLQTG